MRSRNADAAVCSVVLTLVAFVGVVLLWSYGWVITLVCSVLAAVFAVHVLVSPKSRWRSGMLVVLVADILMLVQMWL